MPKAKHLPEEIVPPPSGEHEQWLPIKGLNGYYVSSIGRIFSQRTNKLLRFSSQERYSIICIAGKSHRLCRLVAEAFVEGKTEERWQVNHKDGQKFNDRASNLEWVSPRENAIHAVKLGLSKYRKVGVPPETVHEVYKDVFWHCLTPYSKEVNRKYQLSGPVMHSIMEGTHYLHQEVAILPPMEWQAANPPPVNSVLGIEQSLTSEEVERWFNDFKNGRSPQAIAKDTANRVGDAVVTAAVTGRLHRQKRGELPLPPSNLHEQRRVVPPCRFDPSAVAEVIRLRTEQRLDLGSIAKKLGISHDVVKLINNNKHFLQKSGDAPLMPKSGKRELPSMRKVNADVIAQVLANAAAGMGLNANCRAVNLGPPTVMKILKGTHPELSRLNSGESVLSS